MVSRCRLLLLNSRSRGNLADLASRRRRRLLLPLLQNLPLKVGSGGQAVSETVSNRLALQLDDGGGGECCCWCCFGPAPTPTAAPGQSQAPLHLPELGFHTGVFRLKSFLLLQQPLQLLRVGHRRCGGRSSLSYSCSEARLLQDTAEFRVQLLAALLGDGAEPARQIRRSRSGGAAVG